jgi:hypothetical protein
MLLSAVFQMGREMAEAEAAFEVEKSVLSAIRLQAAEDGVEVEEFFPKRFSGGIETAVVLVPVLQGTIAFLTKIVTAEINARRYAKLSIDGIQVNGTSERTIRAALEAAVAARNNKS